MIRTTRAWTAAYRRIVEDDHSRRELLWLRAKEKGDMEHARAIESVDPSVRARLWFFHDVSFGELDGLGDEERRLAYAKLYDAHLRWLLL